MTWRSVANRRLVACCLVVASISASGASTASAAPTPNRDRAWMVAFMNEATDYGYAVAGSSPASARFIPVTPWAAYTQASP